MKTSKRPLPSSTHAWSWMEFSERSFGVCEEQQSVKVVQAHRRKLRSIPCQSYLSAETCSVDREKWSMTEAEQRRESRTKRTVGLALTPCELQLDVNDVLPHSMSTPAGLHTI